MAVESSGPSTGRARRCSPQRGHVSVVQTVTVMGETEKMSHVKRGPKHRMARRERAAERAEARSKRSAVEQLNLLRERVGEDGADRERARLIVGLASGMD